VKSKLKNPNSGRIKYKGSCCLCGSNSTTRWYHKVNESGTICKKCQEKDRYSNNTGNTIGKRKDWGKTYEGARNSGKYKKVEWTITKEEWTKKTKECFYCGVNIDHKTTGGTKLDRVDNSKGYTNENTVGCCRQCNVAKNNYSLQEFIDWIDRVYKKKDVI